MLFDLRARGRRRTVQVVYLGLALLFLLGFVGFGVGVGGGGGGIFNALTEGGGSNSASFAGRVAAAEKRTQRHPREAAAWAALAEAQLHEASEPGDITVVGETEQPTAKGKAVLAKVAHSWNTYIALEPHPSTELATKITGIFSEQSLNQPASEMRALQIAIKGNPASVRLYSLLAETAYKAGNLKVGDAAARKTVSLAPATERPRVKKLLAELRKNPFSRTPATLTPGPNGTYIAKQAGKTFTVKSNGKGGYVGVPSGKGAIPTTGATGSKPTTGTTSTSPTTSTAKKK
jgi:hypothetical protein